MPPQSEQTYAEFKEAPALYDEIVAAGIPVSNHYSDLRFPDSEKAREILGRHPVHQKVASTFVVERGHAEAGQLWWDVSFAYLPYWEKCLSNNMERES